MNAERLHALARQLREELEQGEIPTRLSELVSALNEVVQQPQQPQPQQRLSQIRSQLNDVLSSARSNDFSPAWQQHLEELDIDGLLGNRLLEQVEEAFLRNAITPASAAEHLKPLSDEVTRLHQHLVQLTDAMSGLGIGREQLQPGEFELGVLIPRGSVDNQLGQLGEEFQNLRRILLPFYELSTGSRPEPEVRALASSDFTAFLEAAPAAAACVAVALERIIKLYKGILEIRLLRQELIEHEVPEGVVDGIKGWVEARMETGLEEVATELREEFSQVRDDRANELMTEVRNSLRAIANRIDEGYNFEVRHEPLPEPEDDETPADDPGPNFGGMVRSRAPELQFMNVSGRRILELPEGETEMPETPPPA